MHTIDELRDLQTAPLSVKILLTQTRLREWVREYGIDGVYVPFSGGKDSTVLLDIARKMYPDIKAVFVDTGLEYPEIKRFVKAFDNVDWLKPKKNFKQVITEYGYPFPSKEISHKICSTKQHLKEGKETSWAYAFVFGTAMFIAVVIFPQIWSREYYRTVHIYRPFRKRISLSCVP